MDNLGSPALTGIMRHAKPFLAWNLLLDATPDSATPVGVAFLVPSECAVLTKTFCEETARQIR
jgi:hypothetical protein